MLDPKQLERLHNSEDFLAFLSELKDTREAWIAAMHDASTDRIQQISGRILSLDEMLYLAKYAELKAKWDAVRR